MKFNLCKILLPKFLSWNFVFCCCWNSIINILWHVTALCRVIVLLLNVQIYIISKNSILLLWINKRKLWYCTILANIATRYLHIIININTIKIWYINIPCCIGHRYYCVILSVALRSAMLCILHSTHVIHDKWLSSITINYNMFHRDLLTKLNFTSRDARAQFSIPLHVHQNARLHIFFDTIRKGYSGAIQKVF